MRRGTHARVRAGAAQGPVVKGAFAASRPAVSGGHPRGWVYIDPPEPQFLQLPLCETSSYTAAAPTSTYTSDSTGGQLPRSIATTFQSPPRKSPTPRRPQFKAPTMTSIQAPMCKFFIYGEEIG